MRHRCSSWFNRSILKCKFESFRFVKQLCNGFNRSILKCKFHSPWVILLHSYRFNRSILKCKCLWNDRMHQPLCGLIEAYWNVNAFTTWYISCFNCGLIEAYWNVNLLVYYFKIYVIHGLIEAYWNVNCSVDIKGIIHV